MQPSDYKLTAPSSLSTNRKVLSSAPNSYGSIDLTRRRRRKKTNRADAMETNTTSAPNSSTMEIMTTPSITTSSLGSFDEPDEKDTMPPPRSLDEFLEEAAAMSVSVSRSIRTNPTHHHRVHEYEDDNRQNHEITTVLPWRHYLIFVSLGVANSSDASEILCLSYILSDKAFEEEMLGSASAAGLLAATVFAGMLLGGLFLGNLGDWWGRRYIVLLGITVNCFAGFLSAFTTNIWMLSGCRFVSGIGIGATVPPLFALVTELSPPSRRGFWVTIVASFWMVGSIYVGLIGWLLLGKMKTSWRVLAAASALPSLLGSIMVRNWVPESPRFMIFRGTYDNAVRNINGMADMMGYRGPPITRDELLHHYPLPPQPLQDALQITPTSTNQNNDGLSPAIVPSPRMARTLANTYLLSRVITAVHTALQDFVASASLLYTKQLQSTTLPLQMVWFSLSFGSYGLLTWINTLFVEIHLENVYFNALLFAISNLPGNILSALLLDQIGRTKLLTGSILAASLSLLPFAFVAENVKNSGSHRTLTIVVSACLFQCFTCAAWNTIDVLTSELFPTSVRSTGMGVCAATGRIGAMVAQFVNGFLVARPFRLLVVSAITLLLGSMTPYFLHVSDPTGQPVRDFANTTQREEVDDESIVMLSSEQWDRQNKDGETYHRFSSAHGQTS